MNLTMRYNMGQNNNNDFIKKEQSYDVYLPNCRYKIHTYVNHELISKIPKKEQKDYSPEFVEWFVDYWAHNSFAILTDKIPVPNFLKKLVMLRIQEIDPRYDFSPSLANL